MTAFVDGFEKKAFIGSVIGAAGRLAKPIGMRMIKSPVKASLGALGAGFTAYQVGSSMSDATKSLDNARSSGVSMAPPGPTF
jgi:hypothetical protein